MHFHNATSLRIGLTYVKYVMTTPSRSQPEIPIKSNTRHEIRAGRIAYYLLLNGTLTILVITHSDIEVDKVRHQNGLRGTRTELDRDLERVGALGKSAWQGVSCLNRRLTSL